MLEKIEKNYNENNLFILGLAKNSLVLVLELLFSLVSAQLVSQYTSVCLGMALAFFERSPSKLMPGFWICFDSSLASLRK